MKVLNIFKELLVENTRLNVLLDKYTKDKKNSEGKKIKALLGLTQFAQIILADPTTKRPQDFDETNYSLENLEKLQPGAYSNWLLSKYEKPGKFNDERDEVPRDSKQFDKVVSEYRSLFLEDLFKVKDDLKKFTKYKQYFPQDKRDINKFGSPEELFRFLDSFVLPEKLQKEKEKKELKKEIRKQRVGYNHPGATIEVEGERYTVIKISDCGPTGQEAASWYGGFYDYEKGESRWCTSPPNSNYFKGYCKDGPLYVLLANDDQGNVGQRTGLPQERYQFHFPSNQFMDRADIRIDLIKFLTEQAPDLKEYFKPEFAKGLTTGGGKKVEIEYPNSSAAKFIALYGFDEFFTSLPDSITAFIFNNKSNEKMAHDVPPSIGRFKSLEALMFQNCVKSLPEEIGELKNLNFLSLINNPEVKTLPNSIVNLPNLAFVNLAGTKPKLSKEFLDKYAEDDEHPGAGFYSLKV